MLYLLPLICLVVAGLAGRAALLAGHRRAAMIWSAALVLALAVTLATGDGAEGPGGAVLVYLVLLPALIGTALGALAGHRGGRAGRQDRQKGRHD
ncbi:hypothetical protein [Roseivivax sp. CAU 1761]